MKQINDFLIKFLMKVAIIMSQILHNGYAMTKRKFFFLIIDVFLAKQK